MLQVYQARNIEGKTEDFLLQSDKDRQLCAAGLTAIPAIIDPHVHFRVPGCDHKEDWQTGALAAIRGGVTAVFDMPNNRPACISKATFQEKETQIDEQLEKAKIPLRYFLYLGIDRGHLEEIAKMAGHAVALKVFMGSSTGSLLVDDEDSLDRVFALAAAHDILIAVHAEDEAFLRERREALGPSKDPAFHSKVRDREGAVRAVARAIALAKKHKARLAILHVSTPEELALIREAKKSGAFVYAEATPHHLYLSEDDYAQWGTHVIVNPPLRTRRDKEALWEAVADGTIDWIGSDHAPHTLEEKKRAFPDAPSGVPGVEFLLPLMLHAVAMGKISLQRLVELTSGNVRKIFRLPAWEDLVLVDLAKEKKIVQEGVASKCGWTPYAGMTLRGWPRYTILKGEVYVL